MSRLLFAAARGARIQVSYGKNVREPDCVWLKSSIPYRIHPDDEHLQYGLISTALRHKSTNALAGIEFDWDVFPYMDVCPYIPKADYLGWCESGELHRSIFLLILAEALADEGL